MSDDLVRVGVAFVMGGVLAFALAKLLDPPPPPEVIESIAESDWARKWAERFCGGYGEEREKCIREVARKVARSIASNW